MLLAPKERHHLGERPGRDHAKAVHQPGLAGVGLRDHNAVHPPSRRRGRHGQDARRGHQPAAQRELARQRVSGQPVVRQLGRCRQDGHGDGKVESRPVFPQLGGAEVDGHPPQRPLQARMLHGGADPLPGVVDGRPGQPGEMEGRKAPADVRLHGHEVAADTDDRHGVGPRVHRLHRSSGV
jgi:hypothetical protein